MDEANIERIIETRRRLAEEADDALLQEFTEPTETTPKIETVKSILEEKVVNDGIRIRDFMIRAATDKSLLRQIGVKKREIRPIDNDEEDGATHVLETEMFDTSDDLDSFTRSGWVVRLTTYTFHGHSNYNQKPDFSTSKITIDRKTVSLEDDGSQAYENWFKISPENITGHVDTLTYPRVLSLDAVGDSEQNEQYARYKDEHSQLIQEKFEEWLQENEGDFNDFLFNGDFTYDPEEIGIRPGSGYDALVLCSGILQAFFEHYKIDEDDKDNKLVKLF